uniref:RNA-binding S4 domain-containing protein n=1 Tax=Tetraselmis chuii TaxID=63592 RepID=A0A7S1SJM6_9CHLO
MLSPYKFYQYLFATTDADVVKFLKMLTFLPMSEIEAMRGSMQAEGYIPNTAQRLLAEEVTRFVHGQQGVDIALKATAGLAPGSKTTLDAETLDAIADDIPCATLSRADVLERPLVDVMVASGLQSSKSEARRTIKGGGCRVNNRKVDSEAQVVAAEDLLEGRLMLLASGKKNKLLVRVAE